MSDEHDPLTRKKELYDAIEMEAVGIHKKMLEDLEQRQASIVRRARASAQVELTALKLMLTLSRSAKALSVEEGRPPARAERALLLFVPPGRAHEVLGDLQEDYLLTLERHGERFARRWYRWQVVVYAGGRLLTLLGQLGDAIGKLWKPV